MNILWRWIRSSLGKKFLMAASGVALLGFVVLHMLGNLQVFLGSESINHYALMLHSNPELIWPARLGLLVLAAVHIWSSIVLTIENRIARPDRYAEIEFTDSRLASRTMMVTGSVVAAFIVFHLLHFTFRLRAVNLVGTDFKSLLDAVHHQDVYRMLVLGFSSPWISGFYLVGVALLCYHLSHGIRSMFQSLGLVNETNRARVRRLGIVLSTLIFLGYSAIPLAVLMGVVR
jgi:succinate dehydrogenase / fumarate reductase cytochrome b subunit